MLCELLISQPLWSNDKAAEHFLAKNRNSTKYKYNHSYVYIFTSQHYTFQLPDCALQTGELQLPVNSWRFAPEAKI